MSTRKHVKTHHRTRKNLEYALEVGGVWTLDAAEIKRLLMDLDRLQELEEGVRECIPYHRRNLDKCPYSPEYPV